MAKIIDDDYDGGIVYDDYEDDEPVIETPTEIDSGIRDRLEKQRVINTSMGKSYEVIPGVELITENPVEEEKVTGLTSDMPKIKSALKWTIIVIVASIIGGLAGALLNRDKVENLLSFGEEEQINSSQEVINMPIEGTEIAEPREVDRLSIPEGGYSLEYIVATEGDINALSVTYINEDGETVSEEGVQSPWTKQIGAEGDLIPIIAAATSGEGKLTCTIMRDGREDITEMTEGEDPMIQCGE